MKKKLSNAGLSYDDVVNIIQRENKLCYYCKSESDNKLILDRLNNNIGHEASNCKFCCKDWHKARSSKNFQEF